jgi:DNA-binding NtrC family response regulator
MASDPIAGGTASPKPGFVLLVDDEPLFLKALVRILRPEGHRVVTAASRSEAEPHLDDPDIEVVLLDLHLGDASGLEILDELKVRRPELEVVMLTGHASVETAVDAMRKGAFDYLEKPVQDAHRVRATIRRAIERRRLLSRNRELERELADRRSALVGSSRAMRAVDRTIESLRHNESTVLIEGESGTGKELVAAAIHAASPRADGPFVPVDCGALPESIIESELFGHEKGAFTGAVGAPGLFRVAEGGTLFLDEIGEIAPAVQAKLLRALQHKEVRPVGATQTVSVDLRVICATHRDLAAMVAEGSFRRDLYYRLDVVRIALPPLRERRSDVPLLARHFLEKHRTSGSLVEGFAADALEQLTLHPWPGNVRELENAVESALALAHGRLLEVSDFALDRTAGGALEAAPGDLPLSLEAYERHVLVRALRESGGDAREAARRLGIGRSTLYRKLAGHGLKPPRQRLSRAGGEAPAIR